MSSEGGLHAIASWSTERLSDPEMLSRNLIRFDPEVLTRRFNRCPRGLRVLIDNNLRGFPAETEYAPSPTRHRSGGGAPL